MPGERMREEDAARAAHDIPRALLPLLLPLMLDDSDEVSSNHRAGPRMDRVHTQRCGSRLPPLAAALQPLLAATPYLWPRCRRCRAVRCWLCSSWWRCCRGRPLRLRCCRPSTEWTRSARPRMCLCRRRACLHTPLPPGAKRRCRSARRSCCGGGAATETLPFARCAQHQQGQVQGKGRSSCVVKRLGGLLQLAHMLSTSCVGLIRLDVTLLGFFSSGLFQPERSTPIPPNPLPATPL
jgi:hypothetical protein